MGFFWTPWKRVLGETMCPKRYHVKCTILWLLQQDSSAWNVLKSKGIDIADDHANAEQIGEM